MNAANETIRILFAEDVPSDAELARREIKKENINFIWKLVDTEPDFRRELEEFEPDIVISDYAMPAFDGMTALEITREIKPDLPFIIFTGSMNEETAVACMKAGANDYVIKEKIKRLPFAVNEALEKSRTLRENKSMQRRLHEREEMYRNLIQNSKDAIYLLHNRRFELINPEFERMLGYTYDEVKQYEFDLIRLIAPESMPLIEERIRKLDNGEPVSGRYEFTAITKNGIRKEVEASVSYIEYKGGKAAQGIIRDITERKKAERQLKESEARFREIFDSVKNIAVQGYEIDGSVHYWNKASENLYGYSKEEAVGKKIFDLIIPAHMVAGVKKAIKNMFETETPIPSEELLLQRKDDTLVPVYSNHTVVNVLGKQKELYCIDIDLSERNKAREELEKSKTFAYAVANSTPALIYIWDVQKNENIWTNEPHKKFFGKYGVNKDNLDLNDISKLIHKDDLNDLAFKMENLIQGVIEDSFETEIRVKSGNTWMWMSLRISVFQKDANGIPTQIIGAMFDVDKRKKAEDELKLLSRSVEQSPVSIEITDAFGNIQYVNPNFSKITGYTFDEVKGKNSSILKSGKHNDEIYQNLWDTILSGKYWHGELLNRKKNGEHYWEDVSISPITDERGTIRYFVSVREDITEKKKMIEDLTVAKEKAEESDRLKSAFLANMSHEIRTPMNGILGFTNLLKEPDVTPDKIERYVDIINQSGKRMLNTINDIISISKIESGTMEVVLSELNMNQEIEYLYHFFKPEANSRGVELVVHKELSDNNAGIVADKEKLHAVLTNLIKNAIKYTNSGTIELGYNRKHDHFKIYVKDTGIGIEKDRQKAIFERFVQEDNSFSKPYEGAGLGLSIAKGYVEMMGGEIGVQSEKSKGSVFWFTIPFSENPEVKKIEQAQKPGKSGEEVLKKLSILVAEDDKIGRVYLQQLLDNKCRKLIFAENGFEAVNLYRKHKKFDVVLMDIKMPVMDGYSATIKIKELDESAYIIAQTAYALEGDREKALAVGCEGYLTKPLNKTLLIQKITERFQ